MMDNPERNALLEKNASDDEGETVLKTVLGNMELNGKPCQYLNLPEGKKFHIFISYCNKDYDLVKHLMTSLESEYNIKCAFAERDFIAGKTTQENIVDTMQESMKILICLTPNYLESGWCDYENNVAFVMSREERRNCVIPLMLLPCQNIPQGLKVLHYIDARIEPDVCGKIMEAFFHNSTTNCWIPNVIPADLTYNQNEQSQRPTPELIRQQNGMRLICVKASKAVPNCILSNAWKFKPLTKDQKQQLQKDKVKAAILLYKKLLKDLNTTPLLQHFGVLFHRKQLILVVFLAIFASILLSLIGVFLYIIVLNTLMVSIITVVIIIVVVAAVFAFAAVVGIAKIKLKEFVKQLLKRKHPRMPEDTIETMADELIQKNIQNLWKNFLHWWELQNYNQDRHNTFLRKQCLCQMIEPEISLPKIIRSEEVVEV